MRITYNSQILRNHGRFEGFNLGADFCAEHEWGIKELAEAFGLCSEKNYDTVVGIDRYKATKVPIVVREITFQRRNVKYIALFVSSLGFYDYYDDAKIKPMIPYPMERSDGEFVNAAWDSKSFAIVVPYRERDYIHALKKAIEETNVSLYFPTTNNLFGRPGLCVVITTEIPEQFKKDTLEEHVDENKLFDAAMKTGIVDILKKADKRWYALRPAWAESMKNHSDTKYPVIFLLNPESQTKYNFGWFTVEELKLWAKDKGPVIKTK